MLLLFTKVRHILSNSRLGKAGSQS